MKVRVILFIFLAIAVISGAAWWYIYSRAIGNAEAVVQFGAGRQSALAAASQDKALAAFLATSSSTAPAILGSIIPAEGSVQFIGKIESLAKAAGVGVRVQSVGISPASSLTSKANPSNFDALSLSLSVQGKWEAVYRFLKMLESLPYKMRISSVSLSQSIYSAPEAYGHAGKPQSFWSGSVSFSVLKNLSAEDTAK
jgi:hypothetical protein